MNAALLAVALLTSGQTAYRPYVSPYGLPSPPVVSRQPSHRYAPPRFEAPRYSHPRYDGPRYDSPRYDALRHDSPRYAEPRYDEPRYDEPRYVAPRPRVVHRPVVQETAYEPQPYLERHHLVYANIRYHDVENVSEYRVPVLVLVPDPLQPQSWVHVKIYLPAGVPATYKVSDSGKYVEYRSGKYKVQLTVGDRYVKVDYDD